MPNYTKARLLASLQNINEVIEGGAEIDEVDLLVSHIIQEVTQNEYFIEDKKANICSFCGALHNKHVVKFSRFHLNLLVKIFNYVVKTGNYRFSKKDILGLSHTEYGNFYQLQRFWLLFFPTDDNGKKLKGGEWGMPLKRVAGFLRGDIFISEYYVRDKQKKHNVSSETKIRVFDVPESKNDFSQEIPDFVSYEKLWDN